MFYRRTCFRERILKPSKFSTIFLKILGLLKINEGLCKTLNSQDSGYKIQDSKKNMNPES